MKSIEEIMIEDQGYDNPSSRYYGKKIENLIPIEVFMQALACSIADYETRQILQQLREVGD